MKYLVVGGVAAGTKAAAKIKREDRSADVLIVTKGRDISYAGCGLPYYVGGGIATREALIVNSPTSFTGLTGVEVRTGHEAVALDAEAHTVTVRPDDSPEYTEPYDKLVIATGAAPFVPPVPGTELEGVLTLRTPDDAVAIRAQAEKHPDGKAVVCGAGFIGLEVAENLRSRGMDVTVIDAAEQIAPNAFDREMAAYAVRRIEATGIRVLTSTRLLGISGDGRAAAVETDAGPLDADLVVIAIGVRPATGWLGGSGIELERGLVKVDGNMRTNLPDVYAAGDCTLVANGITGAPQWAAMGSTANLAARALALNLTDPHAAVAAPATLGTGVVRLGPGIDAGRTGLTESAAHAAGYKTETAVAVVDDRAHYYPGASSVVVKLVAEAAAGERGHRLLGVQAVGGGAIDKIVDVVALAIHAGLAVEDLNLVDFAYAPPFSTAIHPLVTACYVLENKLTGRFDTFTPAQYAAGEADGYTVVDVQPAPAVPGAEWVDLARVTEGLDGHAPDERLLLVCAKGKRGYLLQNRLKAAGYTRTRVLEGGMTFNAIRQAKP